MTMTAPKVTALSVQQELYAALAEKAGLVARVNALEEAMVKQHALNLELRAALGARSSKPQPKLDPRRIQSAVYFWLRRYDPALKCFWNEAEQVLEVKSVDPNLGSGPDQPDVPRKWTLEQMERYAHHPQMADCSERNKVRALFSIGKGAPAPEQAPAPTSKPSARAEQAVKPAQAVTAEDLAGVNF
jgi:hypothetical protein